MYTKPRNKRETIYRETMLDRNELASTRSIPLIKMQLFSSFFAGKEGMG
jgi:hypothetical protein